METHSSAFILFYWDLCFTWDMVLAVDPVHWARYFIETCASRGASRGTWDWQWILCTEHVILLRHGIGSGSCALSTLFYWDLCFTWCFTWDMVLAVDPVHWARYFIEACASRGTWYWQWVPCSEHETHFLFN